MEKARFIAAAGLGWLFPAVSALAANSVRGHEQGAAAGAIGTAHGLGMIMDAMDGILKQVISSQEEKLTKLVSDYKKALL